VAEALIISGPPGAGKSTTGFRCLELLENAAMVDAELVYLSTAPEDDPLNERIAEQALAALWGVYRAAGIERLLLPRVLMRQNHLELVRRALPGVALTVAWLDASAEVVAARLGAREGGDAVAWHVRRAAEVEASGMRAHADFAVSADRPVEEVAREVLQRAGWLTSV
jgi:predicted ABC-type ATPase